MVCHLLICPAQYIAYIEIRDRASECQRYNSFGLYCNNTKIWVFTDTRGTHSTGVPVGLLNHILSLHARLPEHQLLLQILQRCILHGSLGRGLPEPWWTVRGTGAQEPWWIPLSHWALHSGCTQHTLCFWHVHTCCVWGAPDTPQFYAVCEECIQKTRLFTRSNVFFRSTKAMSCRLHGTFF